MNYAVNLKLSWRHLHFMNIAGHSILTITQVANQVKYTLENSLMEACSGMILLEDLIAEEDGFQL